jgi:hypothetical protein
MTRDVRALMSTLRSSHMRGTWRSPVLFLKGFCKDDALARALPLHQTCVVNHSSRHRCVATMIHSAALHRANSPSSLVIQTLRNSSVQDTRSRLAIYRRD